MAKLLLISLFVCFLILIVNFYDTLRVNLHVGLKTFDHFILSYQDLEKGRSFGDPNNKQINYNSRYPFWQCFNVKNLVLSCMDRSYDAFEKTYYSSFNLYVKSRDEIHDYGLKRGTTEQGCHWFTDEIKKVLKGNKHFCISGNEPLLEDKTYYWTLHKIKTKTGMFNYQVY